MASGCGEGGGDLGSRVERPREELEQPRRMQGGGHVDLPWDEPGQAVAYAAADEPAGAAPLPLNDVDRFEEVQGEPGDGDVSIALEGAPSRGSGVW